MECNREEAIRARDIAHKLFSKNDYVGAKKFGEKAQRLYPNLDGIQHAVAMFNVYRSANNNINGKYVPYWYGVLGITALASSKTVNTQYRKLALLLHPDKNDCQGAEDGFKILLQAKDVLSDSVERSLYDETILSEIFLELLLPDTWKETGSIQEYVPLLQAFIRDLPHEVTKDDRLSQTLNIFKMLVLSVEEEQGFNVLNSIVEYIDFSEISPFVKSIWTDLFTCLESNPTVKFKKSFVVFMSLFVVKHGEADLVCRMNKVELNAFPNILEHIWIPFMRKITQPKEMKLAVVAATKLITETPWLLEPSASKLWGKMLDNIITLVSQLEKESVVEERESPEILQNETDPLKEITNPKKFVVESLGRLSSGSPGIYPQIIVENLEQCNQATLLQLCGVYNHWIV